MKFARSDELLCHIRTFIGLRNRLQKYEVADFSKLSSVAGIIVAIAVVVPAIVAVVISYAAPTGNAVVVVVIVVVVVVVVAAPAGGSAVGEIFTHAQPGGTFDEIFWLRGQWNPPQYIPLSLAVYFEDTQQDKCRACIRTGVNMHTYIARHLFGSLSSPLLGPLDAAI